MSKIIEVYSKGERFEVIVDDDIEIPSKLFKKDNYYYFKINQKNISLHRWIMNVTDSKLVVDHANGDHFNNTRENLRVCTQQQNVQNRRSKGYTKCKKTGKYNVSINTNKVYTHIGTYNTKEEAQLAYKIKHVEMFGEFSPYFNDELPSEMPKRSQMVVAGKGYHFDKRVKKYKASISVNKKSKFLGYFDTPEEAQEVYRKAHAEAFGEFSPYYEYYSGITKEVN